MAMAMPPENPVRNKKLCARVLVSRT